MSTEAQDIRAWAKANGIDISPRGAIRKDIRDQYEADQGDDSELPEEDISESDLMPPAEPESPPEPPAPEVSGKVAERPPRPQPRTGRRRSLRERTQRKPRAAKTKKTPPRVSVAGLISGGWTFGAFLAARDQRFVPLARCLDMQAPVAGVVAEDIIRGTMADRLLQPLARLGANGRKGAALIGLPACVGVVTAQPELYPMALPIMRLLVLDYFEIAGPAMEKAQERRAKISEALQGLDPDSIIEGFFAGLPVPTEPSEAEEAAVRRARGE